MPAAPAAVAQPGVASATAASCGDAAKDLQPDVRGLPSNLVLLRQLGKGSYGSVYLCEDRSSGARCAVKQIKDVGERGKSSMRELMLLSRLQHPNLVHLLDFVPVPHPDFADVLFVLPYMPADLRKVIRLGQLTDKHVEVVACQILRGLAFLHASGVAHRDLKPANVLLDAQVNVKICDFGLARGDMHEGEICDGSSELTEYIVTRWWRAPEVMLLPGMYTPAIDLWSMGCILFEMLDGKPLFPGKNHLDMVRRFAEVCGRPADVDITWVPEGSRALAFLKRCCDGARGKGAKIASLLSSASRDAADLVERLLSWDPAKRPSASEAQEHPYLQRHLPRTPLVAPERFDWSFDGGRESSARIRKQLYFECARLHPEILKRDRQDLQALGWKSPEMPTQRSRTPPPRTRDEKGLRRQPPFSSPSSHATTSIPISSISPRPPGAAPLARTRSVVGRRGSEASSSMSRPMFRPAERRPAARGEATVRRKPGETSDDERDAKGGGSGAATGVVATALWRTRSETVCKRRL